MTTKTNKRKSAPRKSAPRKSDPVELSFGKLTVSVDADGFVIPSSIDAATGNRLVAFQQLTKAAHALGFASVADMFAASTDAKRIIKPLSVSHNRLPCYDASVSEIGLFKPLRTVGNINKAVKARYKASIG